MGTFMISVEEARRKILDSIPFRSPVNCPLEDAAGKILAESARSPHPLPLFDNSAMDGYAVRAEETKGATTESPVWFVIRETAAAGTSPNPLLRKEGAIRIFTGAMIPAGADAVVKQEEVVREDGRIFIRRAIETGENIRYQGEEIQKGDLLLQPGQKLTPAATGLLAGAGLGEVPVFSPPRVGVIVTGSEIITGPEELRPGKIFDSNSFSLISALSELHLTSSFIDRSADEPDSLRRVLSEGLSRTDFLIVTGGVSVGDFDFVKDVAHAIGVEEIFWKVKQKPGKPLFFGRRGEKFLFGLPGNPASVLVCFYEYVRPALLRSMGSRDPFLTALRAPLKDGFRKKAGRACFLKAKISADRSVAILENQGSHMMSSFAAADCLVVLPEEKEEFEKGEEVEIHLLPA